MECVMHVPVKLEIFVRFFMSLSAFFLLFSAQNVNAFGACVADANSIGAYFSVADWIY